MRSVFITYCFLAFLVKKKIYFKMCRHSNGHPSARKTFSTMLYVVSCLQHSKCTEFYFISIWMKTYYLDCKSSLIPDFEVKIHKQNS